MAKVYGLYQGDKFIAVGTVQEIAQETGRSIQNILYMTYPAYKKKYEQSLTALAVVKLEDDDD